MKAAQKNEYGVVGGDGVEQSEKWKFLQQNAKMQARTGTKVCVCVEGIKCNKK